MSRPAKSDMKRHSRKFVLYVEGARDREILSHWARRSDRGLARLIEDSAVILGGRQPARAVADFRRRGGLAADLRGLVVLDRDLPSTHFQYPGDPGDPGENFEAESTGEPGLDLFVWGRRHIESYLVVPDVLIRLLGLAADDRRMARFLEEWNADSPSPHAKKMLGAGGALFAAFGRELRAGEIAKAMRLEDLDPEILDLFDRIGQASGRIRSQPEVVVRSRA